MGGYWDIKKKILQFIENQYFNFINFRVVVEHRYFLEKIHYLIEKFETNNIFNTPIDFLLKKIDGSMSIFLIYFMFPEILYILFISNRYELPFKYKQKLRLWTKFEMKYWNIWIPMNKKNWNNENIRFISQNI